MIAPSILRWSACLLIAIALAYPSSIRAEGALAVAQPLDVAEDGFYFGTAYRYSSGAEAREAALERCRKAKSEKLGNLCKLTRTFTHECVAVAMDPKDGTPGVGWAVEKSKQAADAKALAACRATAKGREEFCEISDSGCDN